jgi:hypothetical protein
MTDETFTINAPFLKVDEGLGLIFGYAIVCKENGEDYYDLGELVDGERVQDHITEEAMLESAADFMKNSRVAKEMHTGDQAGDVVFAFPMTSDIAGALDIETPRTGLLVAIRPDSREALAKARRGEYRGFSIGGRRIVDEEV